MEFLAEIYFSYWLFRKLGCFGSGLFAFSSPGIQKITLDKIVCCNVWDHCIYPILWQAQVLDMLRQRVRNRSLSLSSLKGRGSRV